MWKILTITPMISVLTSMLVITGCSSGGSGDSAAAAPVYSGNVLPAAITAANSDVVGRSSTEGVNEAVNLMATGKSVPFAPLAVETRTNNTALARKVKEIALRVLSGTAPAELPTGLVMTFDQLNAETGTGEFCGGSVIVPDNVDPNAALNFSMTFNNLCFDDGITALVMNGVLTFTETANAFSIAFLNFSVNIDGNAETFTGTFSCDTTLSGCTIATDFAGSDGNIFRLENVDISGDNLLGYTIDANFYHHEFGMVTISTPLAITYGSCGIFPHAGTITLAGAASSEMTVAFNSDCTYTLQGFDGNSSFGPGTLSWPL